MTSRKVRPTVKPGTRAVEIQIEAGAHTKCAYCEERVKFIAGHTRAARRQIICNIYEKGKWNRVEHFHLDCYDAAGEPHGPVIERKPQMGFAKVQARTSQRT